jgi:hypothetical protein
MIVDFGPQQDPITEDRIREMIGWTPRRSKLATDWQNALHEPQTADGNWSLVLPFRETFENAFTSMYQGINYHLHQGKRFCVFLNDSQWNEEAVSEARGWLSTVGEHVAIRDCLALSFALDYRMESGDPQKSKTKVGDLCRRAKPYEGNPSYDPKAANELAQICIEFLLKMECYKSAGCVVAMPPSRPDKPFDLPHYIAGEVVVALGKKDLREAVKTVKRRGQLKAVSAEEKLNQLRGTIHVDPGAFKDRSVLIIDDLYQSGTSINYVAMLLMQAGAKKAFGLSCEKTLTNFDNLGSRGAHE